MPEIESQQTDDNVYEVIGANDGRDSTSMDQFIATLEQEFQYPEFARSVAKTDEEIAAEILNGEGQEEIEDETVDDTQTPVEPPPAPVEGSTQPPATSPAPPDTVLVNGKPVAMADLQRLYEFDQYLRNNPEAAQRVQQAVTTIQPPVPAADPPKPPNEVITPPDFLDMDDPAHKFMWESHLEQQRQLQSFQQQTAAREQEALNNKALSEMDTALSKFRSLHPNFNDDQITEMRRHAANMNIASAVMATTVNPVDGFVRILDLAAMDHPDLRTVYLAPAESPTPTRKQRSTERKGKLHSLGGSSGSVSRTTTTPRPVTDREAIDQFAQGLAESFQQN
jgi:hypothetical protein